MTTAGAEPPEPEGDWAELIGKPPDWFYELVGRLAVQAVLLEFYMAALALYVLDGRSPTADSVQKAMRSGGV